MTRDITDIFNQIIDLVPVNDEWCQLQMDMQKICNSLAYTAPETVDRYWHDIAKVLTQHLPDPSKPDTPEFCKQIAKIFSGK